jgi:hypothetical protein
MINKNFSPIFSIVTVSSASFIVSCNVIAENRPDIDVKRNVDALYNLINDLAKQNDISLIHPEKKQELIDAGNRFFADCIPNCGTIRSQDTRKNGDSLKIAALKEHCKQLLKDNP